MSLADYAGLKQSIADHLDRSDLTSFVDDFIDIAEARHKRDIRIREMLSRSALTVDDRHVALPTGFLQAKTLRLLTNPVTVLTEVALYEMNRQRVETTGKPTLFTVHTTFEFDKSPDQSYSGEIVFYAAVTALSASNTTNALLTRAPDVYLYAALSAAAPFLINDERISVWEGLYANSAGSLMNDERLSSHIGPLFPKVVGATP